MVRMKKAFSLVELSIVLVILGLLVGGILAGQSLIRAAELRAVGSEYQRYVTGINTFRDKYFATPGDMGTATSFWGTAGTCPGTNASPSTSAATCNGDGNGQISNSANANEVFRFWHHLANAGLVEGTYTGVPNSGTATALVAQLGTNIPRSKLNNAGWSALWIGSPTIASTTFFEGNYGNVFYFGAVVTNDLTYGGILKPEEAWNLDTKLDDGKPGTGGITSLEAYGGTGSGACSDTASSNSVSVANSNYSLTNTGANCSLVMKSGA